MTCLKGTHFYIALQLPHNSKIFATDFTCKMAENAKATCKIYFFFQGKLWSLMIFK